MFTHKAFASILVAIFIGISACSPVLPTTGATQDPFQATAALQTHVADIVMKTQSAQTQVGGLTATAIAQQTEISNSVAGTLTAVMVTTPEFTLTPAFAPSATRTGTNTRTVAQSFASVTLGADTNCRSGPSVAYEILGLIKAGETAEIVGQDSDRSHWVVRLPSDPVVICWIWRNSATVTGAINPVPVFTPQPTPTAAIDFRLTYDSTISCNGAYQVKFKIVNTSTLTWESNQVNVTDRTANVTTTINRDEFSNYAGCTLVGNDSNLAPGEVGITTSDTFASNPSGHDLKATIQVCSADTQGGTCVKKTIAFIP